MDPKRFRYFSNILWAYLTFWNHLTFRLILCSRIFFSAWGVELAISPRDPGSFWGKWISECVCVCLLLRSCPIVQSLEIHRKAHTLISKAGIKIRKCVLITPILVQFNYRVHSSSPPFNIHELLSHIADGLFPLFSKCTNLFIPQIQRKWFQNCSPILYAKTQI